MRHRTWTRIEGSPVALGLYRSYRKLPEAVRAPLRWLTMPRWHLAAALVRWNAANEVLSGPFAGTKLSLSPLSRRHLLSYLLGTQELELWGVIERILARGYANILNIGAADGYYAVGFARRLPDASITAFEALAEYHPALEYAARLNGVADRLTLRGLCDSASLKRELGGARGPTLIFADIEGAEADLLDPETVDELCRADMLVETHDDLRRGCTELLIRRFEQTHDIERICSRPRALTNFPSRQLPALAKCMPATAVELMSERRRGTQEWLYLQVRGECSSRHDPSSTSLRKERA